MMMRDAWAVALRDWKRGTKWWKDVLLLLFALAALLLVGSGIGALVPTVQGMSYVAFFAAGMLAYMIAQPALQVGVEMVSEKKGFFKLLLVAPISRTAILVGKVLSLLIESLKSYVVIGMALLFYFGALSTTHALLFLGIFLGTTLTFIGLGFILAAFFTNKKTADMAFMIIFNALFFLSGIFYPVDLLPKALRYVTYANPMTYAAEGMRYVMAGKAAFPLPLIAGVLITLAVTLPVLGMWLYDSKQRA